MQNGIVAGEDLHGDQLARIGLVGCCVRIGFMRERVDAHLHAGCQRRDAARASVHGVVDRIEDVLPCGSGGRVVVAAMGDMRGY